MSRQKRRRERRRHIETSDDSLMANPRPWYYRYGYHLGVWSGAAIGVIWYAIFQDFIGLIVGIVAGQIAGITLSRLGRRN